MKSERSKSLPECSMQLQQFSRQYSFTRKKLNIKKTLLKINSESAVRFREGN